ncbi:MAG: WD40 repeat domain-containing protein, partial [Planctomycetota bacterium]
ERLLSWAEDGTARLWDPDTGEVVRVLDLARRKAGAIAFPAEGDGLLWAGQDGTVALEDFAGGAVRWRAEGAAGEAPADRAIAPVLRVDTRGRWLVVRGIDGRVRILDPKDGRVLDQVDEEGSQAGVPALSSDGNLLFVPLRRSVDGKSQTVGLVVDLERRRVRGSLRDVPEDVGAAAFGRGAAKNLLAVPGGVDRTLAVYDLASGRRVLTLRGHAGPVTVAAFDLDGEEVASASDDRSARVWEIHPRPGHYGLFGHVRASEPWLVALAPDGSRAVVRAEGLEAQDTSAEGAGLLLVDTETAAPLAALRGGGGPTPAAAFSPDGLLVAVTAEGGGLLLQDVRAEGEVSPARRLAPGIQADHLVSSSDGSRHDARTPDGVLAVVDVADGSVRRLTGEDAKKEEEQRSRAGAPGSAGGVVVVPEKRRIRLLDARSGAFRARIEGFPSDVTAAFVDPTGTWIVTATAAGAVRLWPIDVEAFVEARLPAALHPQVLIDEGLAPPKAIQEAADRYVDEQPCALDAYRLGRQWIEAGRLEEARRRFEEAKRLRPDLGLGPLGLATYEVAKAGRPLVSEEEREEAHARARTYLEEARGLEGVTAETIREDPLLAPWWSAAQGPEPATRQH